MIILIFGTDTFRAQEKVLQMKQAFCEKFDPTGINLAIFPAADQTKGEAGQVLQSACSYPFLGTKRMVIARGVLSDMKKADESLWLDGFARIPETTILILQDQLSQKMMEKKSVVRAIRELSDVHTYSYEPLAGSALQKWIHARFDLRSCECDEDAVIELAVRVGTDLWTLHQEIEKLIAFSAGARVTKLMVKEMVRAQHESQIFELMDALSKKQKSRAYTLLEQERSAGSDDHYLLTMFGRQIRLLLSARAFLDASPHATKQEMAHALDVHPFVAGKVFEQAKLFTLSELRRAHDFLFDADVQLKTGRINPEMAVDLLAKSF